MIEVLRKSGSPRQRQLELPWPGARVTCPKCDGAGHVHRTMQRSRGARHTVIGGKRVTCSACNGSGVVVTPPRPPDT